MGNDAGDKPTSRIGEAIAWALPLLIYAATVIPAAIHNRELLSPDAVAYIRRAMYLSHGQFSASVSGYWSPLLSWTIAPLLWTGIDPIYCARIALTLWGAVLVVTIHWFIRLFTTWNWRWRLGVMSLIALLVVVRAVRQITPDVALAACLFAYFAALMSPRFGRSRRWQLLTGILGGSAYLAKSYGLPFVAVHLPLSLVLRCVATRWMRSESVSEERKEGVASSHFRRSFAVALGGWLLLVVPWIAILSAHYGRFTTNTVGGVARAMLFPGKLGEEEAFQNRLRFFTPPADPYVAQIENPDLTIHASRSPFESAEMMRAQVHRIWRHAKKCGHYIGEFGAFKLSLLTIAMGTCVALGFPRIDVLPWWRAFWLLGTSTLFCSGFLLVYVEPRYIDTLVLTLLLLLGVSIIHGIFRGSARRSVFIIRGMLAAGLCASYAWPLVADFKELFHPQTSIIYRDVAILLKQYGLDGTTASTNRYAGMYLALHMSRKQQTIVALTLDHPLHQEMERALLAGKPKSIVIWTERRDPVEEQRSRSYAYALIKRLGWVRRFKMSKWGRKIEVYAPAEGDPDPYVPLPHIPMTLPTTKLVR